MKKYYHILSLAALTLAAVSTASAQTDEATFSVMTLNVDGLPEKVFSIEVNDDGPKSAGSEIISEYLVQKNCDIVAMQENFNYHWEIWSRMYAGYEHDEWSGGIMTEENPPIDYFHLQNYRFPTDGLNMSWKKDIRPTAFERVLWEKNFGKFCHSCDEIATKGFRRHEFTLPDGTDIVVYNMHMDASVLRDELLGNDKGDRDARKAQWVQLREHILSNLDQRPVIVMGDMNSFYHYDPVKELFIDAINETGRAFTADAWVEVQLHGQYPVFGGEANADEVLDKVIYVNPVNADKAIMPKRVQLDIAGYLKADGKPLGDHYPLIVDFVVTDKVSGITAVKRQGINVSEQTYSLQGTPVSEHVHGIQIKQGQKTIVK